MRISSRYVAAGVALGLALVIGSCSNPAAPRGLPGPGPSMTTVRIEIVAPPSIEPGATVQLVANAIKADGSIENFSNSVQWRTGNSAIVQVTPTGLALGKARGETFVTATYDRMPSPWVRMYVLPSGTFALRGVLTDSGFGVENANITVISGVGTGLTTMSGVGGNFALYGVAGPVQIEVRKAGYRTSVQSTDVTAHAVLNFALATERPRTDFTGTYALTISAAPCLTQRGIFPDDAKRRVYTAGVTQDAGRLTVTLSGAEMIVSNGFGNRFFGFAGPDGSITFNLGYGDLYYGYYTGHFDIVERFETTAYLAGGTAIVTGTKDRLSGDLAGTLQISSRASAPFVPSSSECSAKTHGFEMVRR